MKRLHNPKTFAKTIRTAIKKRGVNQKIMARRAGIHETTACRALQGVGIDVENYLRIVRWIKDATE